MALEEVGPVLREVFNISLDREAEGITADRVKGIPRRAVDVMVLTFGRMGAVRGTANHNARGCTGRMAVHPPGRGREIRGDPTRSPP